MSRIEINDYHIRPITESDDALLAEIIKTNLEKFHLDISGTVYFDPELDHPSKYYTMLPGKRSYFIVTDVRGKILGGCASRSLMGLMTVLNSRNCT